MTSLLHDAPSDSQLRGDQTPRILVAPPAQSSAAEEAILLAESAGLFLDPWQQFTLHHALGERPDGNWSAFEVGLTVPRQNGKSEAIKVRMLAGLLSFGETEIVYSAHEFRTVKTIMRGVERLLRNLDVTYVPKRSHGEESFMLGRDQNDPEAPRISFQSRTKVGGRGLTGDCVILDEAMIIKPEAVGALMPTLASRPNPQIWYAGSAVDQEIHLDGHVFAALRHRALSGSSSRVCYLEWGCEEGADPTSIRERLRSNPSAGYRISLEYIEDEYQAMAHTPKIFAVERLGVGDWPTMDDKTAPVIEPETWMSLADASPDFESPQPRVIAVDRTPLSKIWAIAGANYTLQGAAHVEIGFSQRASVTEVVDKIVDIVSECDPAMLVIDSRSPAAILKPYLIEAGIEPYMTNSAELAVACEGFVEAVDALQISHSGQKVLTESVLGAIKHDLPGGRFSLKGLKGVTASQTLSATLAHWGLLSAGRPAAPSPQPLTAGYAPDAQASVQLYATDDGPDLMSTPF